MIALLAIYLVVAALVAPGSRLWWSLFDDIPRPRRAVYVALVALLWPVFAALFIAGAVLDGLGVIDAYGSPDDGDDGSAS